MAKESTPSSNSFRIAETETFRKFLKKNPGLQRIYNRIQSFIYPQLRQNPFFGPNIKRLKGQFSEVFRFRIGSFRLFYTIDQQDLIVFILSLRDRKDAYGKKR